MLSEISMIKVLICLTSLAALVQVFVSYCRSALATAREVEISERVLKVARVEDKSLCADDFDRFLQLVRLCPENDGERAGIRAVGAYYDLLYVLGRLSNTLAPRVAVWTVRERESSSHFAAVVLDRCISSSRELFAQQASDGL
jgi:hypothetical protein